MLLASHFKVLSPLDLYFYIASKKIDPSHINSLEVIAGKIKLPKPAHVQKLGANEDINEAVKKTLQKNAELLIMGESADKIDYKFAPCCNPIPGDDVFGFLTINEGIKIHRTNCPNAVQLMSKYAYRIIKTRWTKQHEIAFLTGIKLTGLDDVGLVNKITNIITGQMNLNMRSLSFDSVDGVFEGKIMVYVHDTEELEELNSRLTALDGILEVSRFDSEDAE
ncbi:MAG: bifunctional (p)ppGpp synthetase/guanosine-3',5'-bis(diphosphate) 3'-pyrophosphohydrolase [Bacteroidetes bacterium]|nr:bifunctional (p)ppGpp synthetase/guanosine-3',5'-bis(diphosphate) 3'-pyrophosphohydrolase [Bacteroidota bacterium]